MEGFMSHFSFKPRQSFEVGSIVKIGFVSGLEVIRKVPTPRDGYPDFYVLWNSAKNTFYAFQPHNGGLVRCADLNEALHAF
jgi:hypothetical protein